MIFFERNLKNSSKDKRYWEVRNVCRRDSGEFVELAAEHHFQFEIFFVGFESGMDCSANHLLDNRLTVITFWEF